METTAPEDPVAGFVHWMGALLVAVTFSATAYLMISLSDLATPSGCTFSETDPVIRSLELSTSGKELPLTAQPLANKERDITTVAIRLTVDRLPRPNTSMFALIVNLYSPLGRKAQTRDTAVPIAKIVTTLLRTGKGIEMSFMERNEPHALFEEWLAEAQESEINDPNAMALATVDKSGMPDVRTVLLKGHDAQGFVFYTNFEGAKGQQVLATKKAAICFHWKTKRRQVRARGAVELVSDEEADAYFNSRHPQSRLGAWASDQSRPLADRQTLVDRLQHFEDKYGTEDIPRPLHWSGFRILPEAIEFWQDGEFRLHDRIVFTPKEGGWTSQRLYP